MNIIDGPKFFKILMSNGASMISSFWFYIVTRITCRKFFILRIGSNVPVLYPRCFRKGKDNVEKRKGIY